VASNNNVASCYQKINDITNDHNVIGEEEKVITDKLIVKKV